MLREAGTIRECEEHGWMQDRAIPIARSDPSRGVSSEEAVAEITDVLGSIGDTCPECPA